MANFFRLAQSSGGALDFYNNSETPLAAGALVNRGRLVGVLERDVAGNSYGVLHTTPSPVVEGPLDPAAVANYAIGDPVYFNFVTGFCVKTDPTSSGFKVGTAVAGAGNRIGGLTAADGAAVAGDSEIRIRLEAIDA